MIPMRLASAAAALAAALLAPAAARALAAPELAKVVGEIDERHLIHWFRSGS